MLDPFSLPFVQQALWELLLLSVGAGILGTWIVLRGLSFFAHGVAAATFPGLVVASGVGFAGPLGALGTALLFALSAGRLDARRGTSDHSTTTAMLLVGALAVGVILASNVFPAAVNVNSLLFGSLLLIEGRDLWIAGVASAVVLVASLLLGSRWLAIGFDRPSARALGIRSGAADAVLLLLVALMAIAALTAVGSLLAAALMVIPAATVRPWIRGMVRWQLASVVLTALVGAAGLWLSARTNAPPGATIAVLSGVLFTVSTLSHAAVRRPSSRRRVPAVVTALIAAASLGLAGCGSSDDDASDASPAGGSSEKLAVVATTAPVADLVRNVGGETVDVHQILAPGTDPHEYEPRPQDITESADGKVVVASGLGFDGWIDDVMKQGGNSATIVRIGDHVPVQRSAAGHDDHDHEAETADDHDHDHAHEHEGESEAHEDHAHDEKATESAATEAHDHDHAEESTDDHAGHDHGEHDPHWWHDPENAIQAVDQIRDALIAANPGAKDQITANAAAYRKTLQQLDEGVEQCFAAVPEADRKIVTSHDALGYFADAYDVTIVGAVIPSQTTRAQASAADVDRLAREIREQGVKAIFPESSVNPKVAEALAKETNIAADRTLYGDTLGDPGSDGETYVGMIWHNADAIIAGLTGGQRGCTIQGL
ncbi:MAG: zinc ABC transporter substrate-binding protein [Patulibacter sp.]|nr:zinc ABC transporter substrate-binding protein [Patulibacter sp.]